MTEERRSREKIIETAIYTDGSLKKLGTTGLFGGWAFIVVQNCEEIYEAAGSEYGTTNQRMELQAIAYALEYASKTRRPNERVVIYSDSAYAVNCYLQHWYINWLYNGWITSTGKTVANKDLWMKIIPYFDNYWYSLSKVKAHEQNMWNNKCDALAQSAAETLKFTWRGTENE